MRATWYVMEDGSVTDPREVMRDAGGVLRHKDGRSIAHAAHGPRTRSVEVDDVAVSKRETKTRDVRPEEPKRTYRTRETKAE